MHGNRGRDTTPEQRLRSILHKAGLRFRKNHRLLIEGRRTTPDIVFPRARLCVFIDGCFWHGCPQHGKRPKTNRRYWDAKIASNIVRDAEINALLAANGWQVLRIWEHEDPEDGA